MDLLKLGAQLFMQKMGGSSGMDLGAVTGALQGLLPTNGNDLDIGALLEKVQGSGLASMAASWLGDGSNEGISASQIVSMLGQGPVSEFAGKLGIGADQASEGLAGMIPDLMDQSSEGGSLLASAGKSILGSGILGKLFK